MPRGSLIWEMRAITRRLTGLKISMVLVPGRVMTTWPLAMVTWLKPGLPGRSISATWRSLAAKPYTEQLRIVIKRTALIFRMGTGTCHQGIGMQVERDLLPWFFRSPERSFSEVPNPRYRGPGRARFLRVAGWWSG